MRLVNTEDEFVEESLEQEPNADDVPSEGRWETLSQAFAAYHYPLDNLALVQAIVDHVGIHHYEGIKSRSYIKGIRHVGGRIVHIHFGYTGGLRSEAEITDSVGDVDRGTWDGREWWVTHRLNKLRGSNQAGGSAKKPDYGVCPIHHINLPASGTCDFCAG